AQHRRERIAVADRNGRRHARMPRTQQLDRRSVLRGARPQVVPRVAREIDLWRGALGPRGVRAPLGDDLFEEIGHARAASAAPMRWLAAANRTSASRAAPPSIARVATATPSLTLPAKPATQQAAAAFITTPV